MADFELVFEVTIDGKRYPSLAGGLVQAADDLEIGRRNMSALVKRELKIFLNAVAAEMAKRHGRPYPSGTTAKTLSRRSGIAIKSIQKSVKVTGRGLGNIKGHIGVDGRRAIHETGGVIRPKRARYLTIPLDAALKPNGTPKRMSARQWNNTFVNRSKKGNLLIFRKVGSRIIPLYLLVGPGEKIKQIEFKKGGRGRGKAPARLGLQSTLIKRLDKFQDRLAAQIIKEFDIG